jgi:hypothetical protein
LLQKPLQLLVSARLGGALKAAHFNSIDYPNCQQYVEAIVVRLNSVM